jgi:DNA-binding transcriptional LysR family regulator
MFARCILHGMQLSAVNLNLLPVLHALLETQSVAASCRRLGLSASATSHALARLRALFDDALLVRAGRKLVRTPRAEQLRDPLAAMMLELGRMLRAREDVDPSKLRRGFRISTTDHVRQILLRRLDARLRRVAPGVDLFFVGFGPTSLPELREGAHDLAIAVFDTLPPDLHAQPLFEDHLVSVVRAGHPLARRRVTPEAFAAADHVMVAPNGRPGGLVDDLLAKRGLTRRVARVLPTFTDAPFFVAGTDYVLSAPSGFVALFEKELGLRRLKLPFTLPSFLHKLVYHRRSHDDPEHAWLRRELLALGAIKAR